MILLDTNVISEAMKPRPEMRVVEWLDRQAVETLYLSTVSVAELRAGIAYLPAGRRRDELATGLGELLQRLFSGRMLPFDERAAEACGELLGRTRAAGFSVSFGDAQIAAIAEAQGFSVATRDTGPFLSAGLMVIDPWG